MTDDIKFVISSDQHFPAQNDRMIKLYFNVIKWFKPQQIDILGDTSDQACYSKYNDGSTDEFFNMIRKTPEESPMPFVEENERGAREFFETHRKMFPDADIFTALGNHDIRVFDYMDKKAPGWVKEVTPERLWGLDNLGIDYIFYNDLPRKRWGNVYGHHGLSALKGGGDSVRSDMNNLGVSLIRGHSHRAATIYETYELRNERMIGMEIGHMADVKHPLMSYTNLHQWQLAFVVGHITNGQPYFNLVDVHEASDGSLSCWVEGKFFTS